MPEESLQDVIRRVNSMNPKWEKAMNGFIEEG
jgi:hypothetical protein